MITEVEQVTRAIDDAARRWPPEQDRGTLSLRLTEAGHDAVRSERVESSASRRAAIDETHGALPEVYGENYLEELRPEWPA